MCDFYGDWIQQTHPGMDYYCPIEDEVLMEIPELPMEVVIKIVKMMWREADRRAGALKVYGAMSQPPVIIQSGNGPCLIMTDPQHRLFGLGYGRNDYRHDGVVNKATHNHHMTDGGCWGDGDPRLGWRPWESGPSATAKSIGFCKVQRAIPWSDEQRLNWCRQNGYVPSELAYYQRQNWGEGVFGRRGADTIARNDLPDWLANEVMIERYSCNMMPRNLGHYDQAWADHIKGVANQVIYGQRTRLGPDASSEKVALKWIQQEKGDCQRKHKLLKELIATVPVYQGMWEDLKIQEHFGYTAWGRDDGGPSDDPMRGGLSVHHRMGNENHAWVKMREQGENWRKIWNSVYSYQRVGDSINYRKQNRKPGRPNLMRLTTDKKMRSYPNDLGAVKPSKAKYKKIKK